MKCIGSYITKSIGSVIIDKDNGRKCIYMYNRRHSRPVSVKGYRLTITNTVVMTSDAVITGWTAVCTDALLAHTGPRKEQEEVGLTRDASVNGRARSATGWAKLSIC